jgi:SAM-dependent methyltransferase
MRRERSRETRILEAGSGLGYLTFALAQAGYDARGIDISGVAVDNAIATFGELFARADVVDYVAQRPRSFDVVVMTELVEHVPEFETLIDAGLKGLRPGGELLVTTPNKSSYAKDAIWATENPPVHLWWFSEDSMRAVASRLGCSVEFVDFTEFNRAHQRPNGFVEGRRQRTVPFFTPVLDSNGGVNVSRETPLSVRETLRIGLERLGLAESLLALRHRRYIRSHGTSHRRFNMCAVFTKSS